MKHILSVFACLAAGLAHGSGQTYYVDRNHPAASDSNSGTASSPWKTIVYAAEQAKAGDTVLIKAGTYADGDVKVANSGTPGQEIEFSAFPGDEREALIQGAAFRSHGQSHLIVRGLKVVESPSHGFRFEGPGDASLPPAENITIADCATYDTCSSGISIWGIPWQEDPGNYDNIRDVVIEGNLLELGTNGCNGEIITVANGAKNVTVRYNEIRLGDPNMTGGDEGIDFKEGVTDSSIYGNYIHGLSDKAIYIDGGSDPRDPLISNIEIHGNVMMDLPSAGIVITTEGVGDVDGVYVYNNIVADVDGDGFRVYDHPGGRSSGGTVKNVEFVNNTAVGCGRDSGGGFRVDHPTATGIVFRNNIAWDNYDYDLRGESETLIEANIGREAGNIQADPLFVDPGRLNFRLLPTSPALGQALANGAPAVDLDQNPRPAGNGRDLGCYEFADGLVFPYGCGVNPPGSLSVLAGMPLIGGTLTMGIDNPLGTQAPGAIPVLLFSLTAPSDPCGLAIPGTGMAGQGAAGAVLIGLDALDGIVGSPWAGTGNPAPVAGLLPNDTSLVGVPLYTQGLLVGGGGIGLTDAIAFLIDTP